MKITLILYWIARLVAAIIMLQTLYFKFTGAEESVYIFTKMGIEPWGRIGTGVAELLASILILLPATAWVGAVLALGLMLGAIGSHLFVLGIEVQQDGGQLFIYAVIVAVSSLYVLFWNRDKVKHLVKNL
ncbi:MAG: DoxX family protein [Cyclobacteriaceae bacterium]|nr:MAG: DoxX family protein [Cyclobacteriaceae bacterium]